MSLEIKKAEYFNITSDDNAGEAYNLLTSFAQVGVSLLAFKATPAAHQKMQYSLFPNDSKKMAEGAKKAGLTMEGPYTALLIKSNSDEPGECAGVFQKLSLLNITITASSGIADIYNSYGMVLYLNEEDCEKAIAAFKV